MKSLARTTALALVLTLASLGVLWQQGTLKRWLQARAVDYYLRQIQPHLPFEIEEVEADAPLRELLQGRIKSLSATLRWSQWRMRLGGPIDITRPTRESPFFAVKFDAAATLEPVSDATARSTAFSLDLYAKAPENLTHLQEFELYARAKSWEWKRYGLTIESPDLAAAWKGERAELGVSLVKMHWEPARGRRVVLQDASASAEAPLTLKPFALGPELHFNFKGGSAQALWEQARLNLPLSQLPIEGRLRLPQDEGAPEGELQVGPVHFEKHQARLTWKTPAFPIRELTTALIQATDGGSGPFAALNQLALLDVRGGTIQTSGSSELALRPGRHLPDADGLIRVQGGAIQVRQSAMAARGVEIELPFSTARGAQAIVSAEDLYFRKLHARLDRTNLTIDSLGGDLLRPEGVRIHLGSSGRDGKASSIPLVIDGVPLELGALTGTVLGRDKEFDLATSLKLSPVPLENIAHPLCLKNHTHYPPAKIEADLTRVALSPGTIDPDGEVIAHVFDGDIHAEEVGLYGLGSDVPEVDFDLDFNGIQLNQLCAWSGFGEMLGSLRGFAHDVTFQGWLPTHFDFNFDAIPLPHSSSIEMDPEAMHNLVSLFAGDALDHVPVVGHGGMFNKTFDPFFGWISRRMGGFDLEFLGLSLFSSDGAVLLETHEPPELYRLLKKHYIFYGRRFKMPVQSDHYPVVMDEHGLARIFQFMVDRAKGITQNKWDQVKKNGDENENNPDCMPPAF